MLFLVRLKFWISTPFFTIILLHNSNIANYEYKKSPILFHFQLISKPNSDEAREPVISSTPESFIKDTWSPWEKRGENWLCGYRVVWAGSKEDVPKGGRDNTAWSRSL
jgi:hypothetical protein